MNGRSIGAIPGHLLADAYGDDDSKQIGPRRDRPFLIVNSQEAVSFLVTNCHLHLQG